jgi:hypothetical protein
VAFVKGRSGNPLGRPVGHHVASIAFREWCRQLVDSPIVRERVTREMQDGTLHPRLQELLMKYAHGEPEHEIQVKAAVVHVGAASLLRQGLLPVPAGVRLPGGVDRGSSELLSGQVSDVSAAMSASTGARRNADVGAVLEGETVTTQDTPVLEPALART